ncbi:hypothetical protein GT037_002317 [Alternaria burnsii]|uniref:Non-homologous end-joining factor 1 n=1 Tax=Alternaria burnsii TaxID=1187904 RepID=A0A8H7BJL2_9PLEO|nr:uncharacterized protein GT037_002317 [Alternaria burnsii]KAF7680666.1 hypothetical protein GT037_002317 [Alternaria burnsii]
MSCWRVLELCEQPNGKHIPQLLIKPAFDLDSYMVHLTDLSNIWCEELDVYGIVKRAAQEQSPIEVSKQDTAQLVILLDNVEKSLASGEDAICRVTRNDTDGITLHTSICLPEPLDRLTWTFNLQKRTSATLKNELILPLLVSSHIQNERITALISTVTEKDRAISRLIDQFDSNNVDLAAAFPSIGGTKTGRKVVKREQAAKHVPALRPFREAAWRQETEQLEDANLTTLGLFQEALAQTTPRVPRKLKSDQESMWWTGMPTQLGPVTVPAKSKAKKPTPATKSMKVTADSDEETEDEPVESSVPIPSSPHKKTSETEGDSTEDDEDLDALPKSQSKSKGQTIQETIRERTLTPEHYSPPKTASSSVQKAKVSSFRIGGKSTRVESPQPLPGSIDAEQESEVLPTREFVPSSQATQSVMTPKKARKPFRIGGKGKAVDGDASQRAITISPSTNRIRTTQSPTAEPPSSPPPSRAVKEMSPVKEVHEETPEEKAERKRAELKRKNEEAAKKQAQAKKKKRF